MHGKLPGCRVKQATICTNLPQNEVHHRGTSSEVPYHPMQDRSHARYPIDTTIMMQKKKEEVDTIIKQKNNLKEEVQVIQVRRAQIGKTGVISREIN
jgi:hypothetical protein